MFRVQKQMCRTCIYRKGSPLDLKKLENDVRDPRMEGFFVGYRVCHHSTALCCRGFWNAHKDHFTAGQIAQRLNAVEFVSEDRMAKREPLGHNFTKPKRDEMGDEYVVHIPTGTKYYVRPKGYQTSPPQRKRNKRPVQGDLLEGAPAAPMAVARVTRMANDNGGDNV